VVVEVFAGDGDGAHCPDPPVVVAAVDDVVVVWLKFDGVGVGPYSLEKATPL